MNKTDIVRAAASNADVSVNVAGNVIEAFLNEITNFLAKGAHKVQLTGFGTFASKKRAARKGLNPLTRKEITIPASIVCSFRPGKTLKDKLNGRK